MLCKDTYYRGLVRRRENSHRNILESCLDPYETVLYFVSDSC